MNVDGFRFERSLALAAACLDGRVRSAAFDGDSLRLDLPPLLVGDGHMPSADALRALSALYLQAELEQTGLISVAEGLVQIRHELQLTSVQAAEKLERFARRSRDWYPRQAREHLFARLFGLGSAQGLEGAANQDFQQRFATMCVQITRYSQDYAWGQRPSATYEAALIQAIQFLLYNLGARQFGNSLVGGRKIQEQLQMSVDIVGDPQIGVLFGGHGLWDTLRKALGAQSPDIGRLLSRGQSGQRIFNWLGALLPQFEAFQRVRPDQPLIVAGSPVFVWAAAWLTATGIDIASQGAAKASW
jgi:hypothetical protein